MKIILLPVLLVSLLPVVTPTRGGLTPTAPLAFTHVSVIDGTGAASHSDMTVVISDGQIKAFGQSAAIHIPGDAQIVDASGKYLIPGLWDMHIHLTIIPDSSVTQEILAPELIAYGITSVRDMGGDWGRIQALRAAIAEGKIVGPRIISPGPFVDGAQLASAFVVPVSNQTDAEQAVRKLKADGVDFIKVQSQLSLEAWRAVLSEADKSGLTVVGHVPERISAFAVAKSTQRSIEHISPVLPGDAGILLACSGKEDELRAELLDIEHAADQPNADRAGLLKRQRALQSQMVATLDKDKCDSLLTLLARNGVYVAPTQVFGRNILPLSADDLPKYAALNLAPRSMRERWEARRKSVIANSSAEDFALRQKMSDASRSMVGRLNRAGVKLMAGTDAIDAYVLPGLGLHQELEMMVESGLTPSQALQTATHTPAEFLGKLDSSGTIQVGKVADLVLLTANPLENISATQKIDSVVQGGKLFDRKDLDRLLARVRESADTK